jgi:hypothetical protein
VDGLGFTAIIAGAVVALGSTWLTIRAQTKAAEAARKAEQDRDQRLARSDAYVDLLAEVVERALWASSAYTLGPKPDDRTYMRAIARADALGSRAVSDATKVFLFAQREVADANSQGDKAEIARKNETLLAAVRMLRERIAAEVGESRDDSLSDGTVDSANADGSSPGDT